MVAQIIASFDKIAINMIGIVDTNHRALKEQQQRLPPPQLLPQQRLQQRLQLLLQLLLRLRLLLQLPLLQQGLQLHDERYLDTLQGMTSKKLDFSSKVVDLFAINGNRQHILDIRTLKLSF